MKISLPTCALAVAALLTGTALAADAGTGHAKDGARGMMHADTNGDGKVSRDEAAALQAKMQSDWFDKVDTDKDGFLTEDELRQARESRRDRRGEARHRMHEHFKAADVNGDGQLSLDEAQAKMPRLAEKFTTLDTDKNGLLSKEELKQARSGQKPPQG